MSENTGPKFTGILAKPIKFRPVGLLSDQVEADRQWDDDYLERAEALFKHCGTALGDPGAPMKVAMRLAADHVPGFKVAGNPRGGPRKWYNKEAHDLYFAVRILVKSGGHSVLNACRHLVKPGKPYAGQKAHSLKSRYYEVCKNDYFIRFLERERDEGAPVDDWLENAVARSTNIKPD